LVYVLIACVAYLIGIYVIDLVLLAIAVLENRSRIRESRAETFDVIAQSRFTIPVSVIAPMHNEEVLAIPVVEELLALDYPEFEVIVVNDGSTAARSSSSASASHSGRTSASSGGCCPPTRSSRSIAATSPLGLP